MHRADGVEATVMQLGETLMNTMEEEADSSIHDFHSPHR